MSISADKFRNRHCNEELMWIWIDSRFSQRLNSPQSVRQVLLPQKNSIFNHLSHREISCSSRDNFELKFNKMVEVLTVGSKLSFSGKLCCSICLLATAAACTSNRDKTHQHENIKMYTFTCNAKTG